MPQREALVHIGGRIKELPISDYLRNDRRSVKIVRSEQDLIDYLLLPNPLDFVYEIDGSVTITTPIQVPYVSFLRNLTINGYGNNFSELIYTGTSGAMFEGDGITTGGNLFFNNIRLSVTGTGGSLFAMTDADPSKMSAVEFVNVNYENVKDMGYLDSFRQGLIRNGFYFNVEAGLEFRGAWGGGFRIVDTLCLPTAGCVFNFKSAVGHTFGSRFFSNANMILDAATTGYDFRQDTFINDGDFQLIGASFTGSGTPVAATIDGNSVKSVWRDNRGVRDTFEGIVLTNSTQTITNITGIGVWTELTVNSSIEEEVWFQSNSITTFESEYLSSLDTYYRVELSCSLQASSNNALQIQIRKYDPTNTSFVVIKTESLTSNGGTLGTRVEGAYIFKNVNTPILQGERIRVFIRNNSQNRDIVCDAGAELAISKR